MTTLEKHLNNFYLLMKIKITKFFLLRSSWIWKCILCLWILRSMCSKIAHQTTDNFFKGSSFLKNCLHKINKTALVKYYRDLTQCLNTKCSQSRKCAIFFCMFPLKTNVKSLWPDRSTFFGVIAYRHANPNPDSHSTMISDIFGSNRNLNWNKI